MAVGENIKKFRNEIGMTQLELGNRVGLSDRTISAIELGTREINGKALKLVADALSVKIDDFFNEVKI
ncbi:MAG: helix-turn-helix domain-containing protein [Oscillospiraceae bacterium]|nr:helix-turn-helix domain-containing protein [Oscillospiraceae bacterium]